MSLKRKPNRQRDTDKINNIVNNISDRKTKKETRGFIDKETNKQINLSTKAKPVKVTFYLTKELSKKIRYLSIEKEKSMSAIAEKIFQEYFSE